MDKQSLATADYVLNFIPAPERHAALAQRVGSAVLVPATRPRLAARLIFGMLVIVVAIVAILLDMIAFVVVFVGVARTQRLLFGGVFRLFAQQRVPVFLRDLLIIGVDFRKGEEAVAVAAKIGRAHV